MNIKKGDMVSIKQDFIGIQWNGCRVQDAASGLWSGSSITGEPRRAGAGQTVIVIGACKRKVLCRS